ncbi:MAG: DUF4142 domain-containing protein [Ferruginibacter sp.]
MKATLITATAITLCFFISSCNDKRDSSTSTATETTIKDSADAMANNNNAPTVDTAGMASAFIMDASKGGMMEVELGKIAQQNAASKAVKDFGAMMIKDHGTANDEIKVLASQKNVIVNDDLGEHKQQVDDMRAMKGSAFDKTYVDMMVEDHQTDVAKFETAANGPDAAVSAFATKTLPVLRKHLGAIKTIQAGMQK